MAVGKMRLIRPEKMIANRRSRLAVVALGFIGSAPGLNRFYLGHKRIGWIRLGLYFGGAVLFFILPLLGLIVFLSALAWGVVDLFFLYRRKTDVEGNILDTTPRDEKWVKALLFGMVVSIIIGIFLAVTVINLGLSFLEQIRKNPELYSSMNRR